MASGRETLANWDVPVTRGTGKGQQASGGRGSDGEVQVEEEWRDPGDGRFGSKSILLVLVDISSKTLDVHTRGTSLKIWDLSNLSDEFGHLRDGVEQAQFMEFVTNNFLSHLRGITFKRPNMSIITSFIERCHSVR
ncbi:hypothetical protein Leryth_024998 [Lithospermum erythrorhizon]|nr:hypothetical protein Leryth_024998 [Lithospermum erythrorhizon]